MTTTSRIPVRFLKVVTLILSIASIPMAAVAARPSGGGGGKCPAGSVSQPKSGHCIIPVTTIVSDIDANGLPADIASDDLGPYTHGGNGVTSWLTSNGYNGIAFGDWQFDTYASTLRLVNHSLDPEDAVQPGDPHYTAPANPPFWGTMALTSRITVKCTLVYNNMLAMTAGSSFICPMINKFNVGGLDYHMSPAYSFTRFADTTDVQVRCNTSNSGGCNDWSIEPIGPEPAVGRVVSSADNTINYGDFYMRFRIRITRP
jgi:hypothetical protein